jgi:DNA-binding MarR family transcriptional regulator
MNDLKINRIYKWQENTELKINCIKEFVKVERHHDIKLTPAEEFTLYVLRIHYDGYSAAQGVYADFMGVSSNRFSEYTDSLQDKGFIKKQKKPNGRSIFYEMLREPKKDWNKIPKSFIRDHYIDWKDRLFIIKLFNLILNDVNEIHYIDKDIAKLIVSI